MRASARITTVGALAAALAVVPTVGAVGAPRAPVNNVITARQFPGFTVTDTPAVLPTEEPFDDPCEASQPTDSVTVYTRLERTTEVSDTVTRQVSVTQLLLRFRTWQQAHIFFAKDRAVLRVPACTAPDDGAGTSTTTVEPSTVRGADEGFVAAARYAEGGRVDRDRVYVHRIGRDIVVIRPQGAVFRGSREDREVTFEDTAATRNLGRLGVAAAIERLRPARSPRPEAAG